jgi:flagellar assembly protein FliH
MPSSSRIVFAEDLTEVAPWQPGLLAGAKRAGPLHAATASRQGSGDPTYEDGLRDGHARGLQDARSQARAAEQEALAAIARRGDALIGALTTQLAGLQQSVAEELTGLAVEIARNAFGAALRVRDDAVVPAVVAALAAIVEDSARPTIRLHPDDAALVGEQLAPMLAARGAQLVPDDGIVPGGCRVDTARGSVDATVQTRWRRALQAIGRDDAWVDA